MKIDQYLRGEKPDKTVEEKFEDFLSQVKVFDDSEDIGIIGGRPRISLKHMPPEERKTSFVEYTEGYTIAEARAEADRCLKCYRVAMVAV